MSNKLNIGFIGCGGWARKKYLSQLSKDSSISTIHISDIKLDSEREKILSINPRVNFYENSEEMFSESQIYGVIISLPHALHYDACLASINNRIPTLVDKPLAPTYLQANKLVKTALERGTILGVASQRRASEGVQLLKEVITKNKIKEPIWIKADFLFYSYANWQETWRNNPSLSGVDGLGQGMLLDAGYHLIDSILYILNRFPIRVFSEMSNTDYEVDTESFSILSFSDGLKVGMHISRSLPHGLEEEKISMLGNESLATYYKSENNGEKSEKFFYNTGKTNDERTLKKTNYQYEPINDFIRALSSGRKREFIRKWGATHTLDTLKVIDALYESSNTKSVVRL